MARTQSYRERKRKASYPRVRVATVSRISVHWSVRQKGIDKQGSVLAVVSIGPSCLLNQEQPPLH